MLLSNVKLKKSTFWHHYSDWSEWNDNDFFLCCVFYQGLSCQLELTNHISCFSLEGLLAQRAFPPHFRCLFVWSPPSLYVPIKQNTEVKNKIVIISINTSQDFFLKRLGRKLNCMHWGKCMQGKLQHRITIFLMSAQPALARWCVCTRFHWPGNGVSRKPNSFEQVCAPWRGGSLWIIGLTWKTSVTGHLAQWDFCSSTAHTQMLL